MTTVQLDTCLYCEDEKPVTLFDGELVCMDCRIDFIEQEFKEPEDHTIPEDIRYKIALGIPF